ncbi:hypothetical protein BWGOE3_34290 [Bacillus mycoides]|uniref:hypothetical protein n=1 Tax=Bacillus TaxID=1386 RepID=UPI00027C0CE0|nr:MULTISPECIES: hypothetical protein [Bacillus]EJV56369.1 hypothetical protein IEM_05251 [Bacillus cereus BAG6O-2]MDM5459968.1 hypothetical protein [Bacillus cereus]MED1059171.1 hypothetical protein [Bacillus mycoides]OFD42176.1 hypothetical protein BWGOE3_34290 [Bacillus mycoides]PQZ48732.1 hypothetical protein CQZ94_27215 [Bacillus sp. MYb209]
MKTFGKVLLTGALALGGFTAMNINTSKAHADGASEYCRYICGPSETVNNFTIQLHATEYGFGQNVIAKVTNDRAESVNYKVSIEKQYETGWDYYETWFNWNSMLPAGTNEEIVTFSGNGEDIWDAGTFRYKVEVTNADSSVDTIYTAPMTITQ